MSEWHVIPSRSRVPNTILVLMPTSISFFKILTCGYVYWFFFRERGSGERERETLVWKRIITWLPPAGALSWYLPYHTGRFSNQNRTCNILVCWMTFQPTKSPGQAPPLISISTSYSLSEEYTLIYTASYLAFTPEYLIPFDSKYAQNKAHDFSARRSSGQATPKYAALAYWLFRAEGTCKRANVRRGFLWTSPHLPNGTSSEGTQLLSVLSSRTSSTREG